MNHCWDLVAWNSAYCALFGDMAAIPIDERNCLWLAFSDPLIVLYRLMQREPGKKRNKKKHAHDRNVIGLCDDQAKVRIDYADSKKREHAGKHDSRRLVGIELMGIFQRNQKQNGGGRNQIIGSRERIDYFF